MKILAAFVLALGPIACGSTALAQQWYWYGPQDLSPGESRLIMAPGIPGTAERFTILDTNNPAYAFLPLELPTDSRIDSVTVCYQLSSTASYIEQIRFLYMTTPDGASVSEDLPTHLNSAAIACVTQPVHYTVTDRSGIMELGLRMAFASTSDYIEIGAIGVYAHPNHTSQVGDESSDIPAQSTTKSSPNPFNPDTRIGFDLVQEAPVNLSVFDVGGRRVATLIDGLASAGRHEVNWNGKDDNGHPQTSGVYLYRLEAAGKTETGRMTLLR